MAEFAFNRVVVCGVGLIGGSFALALRKAEVAKEVVGIGRSPEPLVVALKRGVIDAIADNWAEALPGADLVLLGMPVGQMPSVMQSLVPYLEDHTVVTDAGSTKGDVVAAAYACFGPRIGQFVPGHPIAGAEKSGIEAASADLYRNRRVVIAPLPENSAATVDRVRRAWRACGATVSELSPDNHDRVFAAVSHLPHLLAFSLVHEFLNRANADQLFSFAASGFRDFTRIASSHPEMWRDICLANRGALLDELDAYMAELMRARVLLARGDGTGLEAMFSNARERRDSWLESIT